METQSDEIYIRLYAAALTGCLTNNKHLADPHMQRGKESFKLLAERADGIASAAFDLLTSRSLDQHS